MPFLEEQELESLHKEIYEAESKQEELEIDLNDCEEELESIKKKARKLNLFFAILAGASLAFAFFLYNSKTPSKTNVLPATETTEPIATNDEDEMEEDIANVKTVDESVTELKNEISGQTIYSVQIGVFSKNKFPLLSQTIAGTSSLSDVFKYSVGLFKTLQEAQDFRRELVKIGFRDAFVASYIDGERQQIHKPN